MKLPQLINYLIYAVIVILAVFILVLIVITPSTFSATKSVYQGF